MKRGWLLARRPTERRATRSTGRPLTAHPPIGPRRTLLLFFITATVGAGLVLVACSKHRPARLPVADIYARNTSRLEVSAIVVADERRAERAREIYLAIAELGERLQKDRQRTAERIVQLTAQPTLDVAQVETVVGQIKQEQRAAFARYVELQMDLRKTLTAEEFKRLGRFH